MTTWTMIIRNLFRKSRRQTAKSRRQNLRKPLVELLEDRVVPANFTAGNLAVLEAANTTSDTTGSILELSPTIANQSTPVQTIAINNVLISGGAGTVGYLADSDNGTLLTLAGYEPGTSPSNVNDIPQRYAVAVDYTTAQTLGEQYQVPGAASNTNTARSAATLDGNTYFNADQGGLYSNNESANSGTFTTAMEAVKPFGGTMYSGSKSTAGAVEIVPSATSTTLTPLTGIGADSGFADFYMVSSGANGSTYDVMYTLDATGAINKFSSSNGTTWTADGTYTGLTGGARMAAEWNGSGTTLFVTDGGAGTANNNLWALTDNSAWNAPINITTASNTLLYTAPGTGANATTLYGVAFVPTSSSNVLTSAAVPTYTTGTINAGQSATFTDVVTALEGSTAPPAGTVKFFSSTGTLLATATSATTTGTGQSTFSVTSTTVPVGTWTGVVAVYDPAGYSASASLPATGTLTVNGITTTTAAPTFTPATVQVGQSVTYTVIVSSSSGAPTAGTVTFESGSTVLATATTESTSGNNATFTVAASTSTLGVGTFSNITAVYSGNGNFNTSTSAASSTSLTVTAVPLPAGTIAQWTFENQAIALNNNPAPDIGVGTADSIGMTATANISSITESGTTATLTLGSAFFGQTTGTVKLVLSGNTPTAYNGQFTVTPTSSTTATFTAPSGTGSATTDGTATGYGTPNVGVTTDDVLQGATGDTGANGLADLSHVWRVRAQAGSNGAANGWSSFAPIGTQGAQFFTSTAGLSGPINISFDWYATSSGEANLQLEYTTNGGTTWTNVPITVPAADADISALTNSSSSNTVMGSYVHISNAASPGPQEWAQGLTASINDPNADNDAGFGIEMVNASQGADDVNAGGTALGNSSGNWRFDNVDIAAPQSYTPGNVVLLQVGNGSATYTQAPVSLDEVNENQNNQVAISGTTADALGNVTVTTTGTQTFTAGQWVQISGVQLGTNTTDAYNGVYSILTVNNAGNTFTYFNQLAANLTAGTPATNGAWASNIVQQDAIPDTTGTGSTGISAVSGTGTATATVTTSTTALYGVGESLTFSGITPSAWDNTFTVASIISPTQFTITQNLPAITSPLTSAVITPPNQPLTISLNQPLSVGQLNRSADGSALTLAGIDSGTDPSNTTVLPISTDGRDLAVISGNPNIPSDINTSTYGAWNGGDDTRTAIAETAYGPIYEVGHNQDVSGFPAYVGVHEFSTEGSGPTLGTQVSASTNIRAVTIGPDNRMYFVTAAGLSSVNSSPGIAGVYTDAAALPASNSATPSADIMVVPNYVTNAKLNGMYIADMNGTGVISNGDRLYYINGDTASAGGAGLFVATWNTSNDYPWDTPNNAGAQAAGILDYWGLPVRLGDAPVQTGSTSIGTMIGIAGTVLSLNNPTTGAPGTVELYTNAHDTAVGDDSILQQWMDSGSGVTITSAQLSGNQITITTASPTNFTNGEWVTMDGIGDGGGSSYSVTGMAVGLVTGGDNGTFQVSNVSNPVGGPYTFTYTDTQSGRVSVSNAGGVGAADAAITSDLSQASTYQSFGIGINNNNSGNYNGLAETFGGTIVQTLAGGSDVSGTGSLAKPQVTIGGIAFAPVAPTSVTLSNDSGTLTAILTNSQVTPSGQVAFINENTGAVLGFGTISGSAPYTATLSDSTVVGDAYVEAYFAGGGTLALAPAQSNVIQVNNGGSTADSVTVSPSVAAVAVNTPVILTATVTPSSGPTGNVSFYNTTGGVQPSLSNLIGTVALTGNTAALTAAFPNTGTQTITAVYNGDATYESNSNTTTVSVAANATAAITSSANNVSVNSVESYTVTLTGNATLGSPTGSVVFTLTSALNNTTGHAAQTATSSSITLVAGANDTATATWNGPTLAHPGSYLITMSYSEDGATGYSGFSITPEASGANYTNTALIENVDQAFTPGNVVIVQRGDGTIQTGSSGGLVELDEYTPTGTEVQSIILPNQPTGGNNPFVSGSQNSGLGLINRSANGAYETLIGYDTELGTQFLTSTFPYLMPRTIAEVGLGGAGTVNTTTAISTTAPDSVPYEQEDAVSNDGDEFWIVSSLPPGDTTESGIEYVSSVGATSATQLTGGGTTGTAITIAGGQLYSTGGSGNVDAVGTGLPTTATQTLTGLPNLQNQYQNYFTSNRNPEQVLLLNTTDGTTNNPNVAYVADQAQGLLKFSLNSVSLSLSSSGTTATATVSSGSLYFLDNGSDQVQITGAPGYNGIYTLPASAISGQSFTFSLPNGGSNLASTNGTGGQWLYGQYGTGTFGQKLVFAGGATGVTGYVVNPGNSGYSVQLYVTGANVQGLNPNEFVTLDDTNAASFPSGNFTLAAVDGASGANGGTSNANANFAGIAWVPADPSTTTVAPFTVNVGSTTMVTATIVSTSGLDTAGPQGTVTFTNSFGTVIGTVALTESGSSTTTATASITVSDTLLGELPGGVFSNAVTATYNPGGYSLVVDAVSSGLGSGTIVAPTVTASTANLPATAATVTINGISFDPSAANDSVSFNDGAAGTVTSATTTSLTVTFTTQPTTAGSLTAVVTVADPISSGAAVQVATVTPVVTSSSTSLPSTSSTVTIDGYGFDPTAANNTVTLNDGAAGTVTSATDTSLTVTFSTQPSAAGSLTAVVTTDSLTSGSPVQVANVTVAASGLVVYEPFNYYVPTNSVNPAVPATGIPTISMIGEGPAVAGSDTSIGLSGGYFSRDSVTEEITAQQLAYPAADGTVPAGVAPIGNSALSIYSGGQGNLIDLSGSGQFGDPASGTSTYWISLLEQPTNDSNYAGWAFENSSGGGFLLGYGNDGSNHDLGGFAAGGSWTETTQNTVIPNGTTTYNLVAEVQFTAGGNTVVTTWMDPGFTTQPAAGSALNTLTGNGFDMGTTTYMGYYTYQPIYVGEVRVASSFAGLWSNPTQQGVTATPSGPASDPRTNGTIVPDSYDATYNGSVNTGVAGGIKVVAIGQGTSNAGLFQFGSLSSYVPAGDTITSASVVLTSLYPSPSYGGPPLATAAYQITSAWDVESPDPTPTIDATAITSGSGVQNDGLYTYNITSLAQEWLADPSSDDGIAIAQTTQNSQWDVFSYLGGTSTSHNYFYGERPVLVLTVAAQVGPTVTGNTGNLPANAPALTISGTGFDTTTANNTVTFNDGAAGIVTSATATSLTVTFSTGPAMAGMLTAVVTTDSVTSGAAVQVATVTPVVTSSTAGMLQLTPTLTISGYGFDPIAGNNTVTFNDGAAGIVTSATATTLTVAFTTAPTAAGSLTAVVTTDSVTSGAAVQVATVTFVNSVVVNADYAPIVDISSNGVSTVTVTTDGNNGFTAGNTVVISGYTGANAGYDGTFTVQSASGDQFTVTNTTPGLATLSGNSAGFAISQNTASALRGNQRSMVDSVVYAFTAPVNLTASNFTLTTSAPSVSGAPSSAPAPATLYPGMALTSLGGGSIWVVSWVSGGGTGATVSGHSLADGVYNITLGNSNEGTDTFFRLYGNVIGFNSTSHTASLNNQDSLTFTHSYLLSTGAALYLADSDYDANGVINNTDSLNFTHRYLSVWSGFLPTI